MTAPRCSLCDPEHLPLQARMMEFCRALLNPYTYSLRNTDVIFGFLWGLPIPFVTMAIYLHAAQMPWTIESAGNVMAANPYFYILALHPILFAIIFGAQGTLRMRRDHRISALLKAEEERCAELCRANAKLQEVDRLKSEFLANVTHELKSPLVTALGYTDRIMTKHLGEVNERQTKGLEIAKRNLVRLRKLIDEILDFSRLDAGVARFEMVPTDLRQTVHTAVENLSLRAKEKNITVHTTVPQSQALVTGDFGKLTQIVINLLDNALKFTPQDGRVEVKLYRRDDAWHLSVEDDGEGIPADVVPKLFQRFFQADGSLARPHNGFGLGLVIVKKIVEAHHGRVWLESTLGQGTQLHVELPVCDTPAADLNTPEIKEVEYAKNSAH